VTGGVGETDGRRIAALIQLVEAVEAALETKDYRGGRTLANQLARSTSAWIDETQHDPEADAELTAALKVFRNAAFAFRQLSKASRGARNITMASTCGTLIAQGRDVLQTYLDRHGLPG
jgi:hypothetical protein